LEQRRKENNELAILATRKGVECCLIPNVEGRVKLKFLA
jgi:hypothetical protein